MLSFPTSKDISIEVNGQRLAVVQSFRANTKRESRHVEAFGSTEPVGTIGGRVQYQIELSRVALLPDALKNGINFHSLDGFNLVIVYPGRRVIYSGCEWAAISETAALGAAVLETVTVLAAKRMETE